MAKSFFQTVDGRRYPDEDGSELADWAAVRQKATLILGERLKEEPSELWRTGRLKAGGRGRQGRRRVRGGSLVDGRNRGLSQLGLKAPDELLREQGLRPRSPRPPPRRPASGRRSS